MLKEIADFLYSVPYIYATDYERSFFCDWYTNWSSQNYWIPFTLVSIYMLFCFFGSKIMKNREPFGLTSLLALWNASLSLFSFIGVIKTAPYLIANLLNGYHNHNSIYESYYDSICLEPRESWGAGPTGFWVMLFIYSKIPELIDTVFIVLRKKPLIFLHWYHHVTVLLYCWDAFSGLTGSGLYFVAMNYTVHSMMYAYYCMQALKCVPKNFPTVLITLSQISQMFVGTFVCCSSWYFMYKGATCSISMTNLIAGAIMYGSYLYLFVAFAVKRFVVKPKAKKIESDTKKFR